MSRIRGGNAGFFALAAAFVFMVGPAGVLATRQLSRPVVTAKYRGVSTAVHFDVSPPLRDLARQQPLRPAPGEGERRSDLPTGLEGSPGPQGIDPIVQSDIVSVTDVPGPLQSFDGITQTSGPVPPDPVGDVGPNHYVQMVNVRYAVFNKTGTLLLGPANINTLWAGFGGACQNENSGDPIVLYDQLADRWLLTQFTSAGPTYFNCVALSTGPDPTGTYFRWAFSTGSNFPDYPKYGIWSDGYYISTREFAGSGFAGIGAYALNKTQLLAGNPTPQMISFLAPTSPAHLAGDGLLPSDIDGTLLPPAGSPNYYIGSRDNGGPYGAPSDALNIWKFTANFVTPSSSSFVLANTVPVTEFDSMLSTCSGRNCVPQPTTAQRLDHQGYRQRPLHRAAYRNFGTHESIVTNQSVEVTGAMSGIRWWEIRSPNSSPAIFQEGTFAPGVVDNIHRWFGSIAQDQTGNMALGYSASDATATFPSVRYTGRLVSDPLGTMQAEGSFVSGGGSQLSTAARWGDYSSMNVDPNDDCTFWYTTEYYAATSTSGWRTRVGSFKFPSCGSAEPLPTLTSILPSSGAPGRTVYSRLQGTNFVVGATAVQVSGSGVTVDKVNIDLPGTGTQVVARLLIDPGAALGPRDVTVSTSAGTSNAQTFTVRRPDAQLSFVTMPLQAAGSRGSLQITAGIGTTREITGTWVAGWMVFQPKSVLFTGRTLFSGTLASANPPLTRTLSVNMAPAPAVAVLNAFYNPYLSNFTVAWAPTNGLGTTHQPVSHAEIEAFLRNVDLRDFDGATKEVPR